MVAWQITPIHLVGDQDIRLNRFLPRHTASVGDRAGRFGLFNRHTMISSFENDFARIVRQASALQQGSQRHARPFRVADRAQFPLGASDLWDEKDATIARALQRRDPCFGPHVPQFVIAQHQRVPDRTVEPQSITGDVEPRRREMTPDVKQFRRGQVLIELIERHLKISGLLLPNDEAGRRGSTELVDVPAV
jgi:hypothetical protein